MTLQSSKVKVFKTGLRFAKMVVFDDYDKSHMKYEVHATLKATQK